MVADAVPTAPVDLYVLLLFDNVEFVTLIVIVFFTLIGSALIVIVAVPFFHAFKLPFLSTLTIFGSELL